MSNISKINWDIKLFFFLCEHQCLATGLARMDMSKLLQNNKWEIYSENKIEGSLKLSLTVFLSLLWQVNSIFFSGVYFLKKIYFCLYLGQRQPKYKAFWHYVWWYFSAGVFAHGALNWSDCRILESPAL